MRIFAIDPGNVTSSWVLLETSATWPPRLEDYALDEENALLEARLHRARWDVAVIEMVRSYGRPVGSEIFETCVWIGRFEKAIDASTASRARIGRQEMKSALGLTMKTSDSGVRACMLDIYGGKDVALGSKTRRGPLWGVTEDVWAALAVGIAYARDVERKRVGT